MKVIYMISDTGCVRGTYPNRRAIRTFHSPHEGYAVIKEELDELWDEIKSGRNDRGILQSEVRQVAAMALRFLVDLC